MEETNVNSNRNGRFTSRKSYKTSILKQTLKIFCPMALNVQWIFLKHKELHFLGCSIRGVVCNLISVLGPFLIICDHEIFVKLKLPIFLVLVRQREKSQKYPGLFAFN